MDSFHDYIHRNFGLHVYRPSIKVRKDAFYEYLPSNTPKDNFVMNRLSSTISDLTKTCFDACVVSSYGTYTREEQICVKKCVESYFQGFQQIVFYTQSRMKQQNQNSTGDEQ